MAKLSNIFYHCSTYEYDGNSFTLTSHRVLSSFQYRSEKLILKRLGFIYNRSLKCWERTAMCSDVKSYVSSVYFTRL